MIPRALDNFDDDAEDDPGSLPPANDFNDDADPTTIDLVSPFDSSTTYLARSNELAGGSHSVELASDLNVPSIELAPDLPVPRATQLTVDPPTALVRRDSFRELPSGTIVGENYEVEARLGAGAMGEVYAARHVGLGKRVAIKVIHQRLSENDGAIRRFATEARALAQIQHPSIVAVEHVGELPDGRAYFVMEYLRGESLSARLARGPVPLREALRILDQMARAIEAAHGSGVIHRDLKPDNTFLVHLPGEEPAVKLLDFGLVKLAAESAEVDVRTARSESGVAIGTPLYMSPEQARGPDVDHRTDIYALGCVAYELVLGTRPFPQAKSAPEVYAAHLHASPPLPRSIWPEIPPQLDLALFAMLAKDPAHRPTLAQVRAVAANLATPFSPRTATMLIGPRPLKKARRSVAPTVLAISALILGAALGAAFGASLLHPTSTRAQVPPDVSAGRAPAPIISADRSAAGPGDIGPTSQTPRPVNPSTPHANHRNP